MTFNEELNALKFHLPGSAEISMTEDDALARFLADQSPNWNTRGCVTAIPVARVPRVFLRDSEMTKNMVNRYRTIQRGEAGEIAIYKKLTGLNSLSLPSGTLIFPNVDGTHFSSKEAKVEIDVVVIDSCKGVFVLNVKNIARVKEANLVKDMEKHTTFIRLIRDFNSNDQAVSVPVHGIICSSKNFVETQKLEQSGYWKTAERNEKRFVFQPNQVGDFGLAWQEMLESIPDIQQNESGQLLKLACRLVVLNCMDGTLAHLHEKFESNSIQEIKLKENEASEVLTDTLSRSDDSAAANYEEIAASMMKLDPGDDAPIAKHSNKKSMVLWTKEQLNVICRIHSHLKRPESAKKGCRILVTGPKGSGKTMLLCYVAELAKLVLSTGRGNKNKQPTILVCDGRFDSSLILFEKLKGEFDSREISVLTGTFGSDAMHRKYDLVLVDEYVHNLGHQQICKIAKIQHCIMFSSDRSHSAPSEFEKLQLSCSLRASMELTRFSEEFRKLDTNTTNPHISLKVGHNYRGQDPTVIVVNSNSKNDPQNDLYTEKAIDFIVKALRESRGLKSVLVAPFVHPVTLSRVITKLVDSNIEYDYRNPFDVLSKSRSVFDGTSEQDDDLMIPTPYPTVTFVTGNHVDGAEYGSVVVLVERSLPHFWHTFLFDSLFTAFTRATTKLVIIVNNAIDAPLIGNIGPKKIKAQDDPKVWFEASSKMALHPAYSLIQTADSNLQQRIDMILESLPCSKLPVILSGLNLIGNDWFEIDPPPQLDLWSTANARKLKWFRLPNESILALPKSEDYLCLEDILHFQEFSALILVAQSEAEYFRILQINRHFLLYIMHEKQLENSPIFLLTTFDIRHSDTGVLAICDFLAKYSQESCNFTKQNDQTSHVLMEKNTTSVTKNQKSKNQDSVLQKQGKTHELTNKLDEDFGKISPHKLITELKREFDSLSKQYHTELSQMSIAKLIEARKSLAQLSSEIGHVAYKLALDPNEPTEEHLQRTEEFCEKSLEFNPYLIEPYACLEKCFKLQSNEHKMVQNKKQADEAKQILRLEMSERKIAEEVIQDKIKRSPCYDMIKFKTACYLLDGTEDYCHHSVYGAILAAHSSGIEKVSLLMNPGVYEEPRSVTLGLLHPRCIPCEVDIVGNWVPSDGDDSSTNCITTDSPIVIQNLADSHSIYSRSTFDLYMGRLSLTRVCVINSQTIRMSAIFGNDQ